MCYYKMTLYSGRNGTTASRRCDYRRIWLFSHNFVLQWGLGDKITLFVEFNVSKVLFMNQGNKSQMGEKSTPIKFQSSLRICGPLSLYLCYLKFCLILISCLSSKYFLEREWIWYKWQLCYNNWWLGIL